jgi:frataxin-like iron-binding protein CyaY
MSYWTKRRKVCRNVDKHFAEIENAISDSEEELICSFDYKSKKKIFSNRMKTQFNSRSTLVICP